MLPSTGLFQSYACPYFNSGSLSSKDINTKSEILGVIRTCQRPYCHFSHAKKEDETEMAISTTTMVPNTTTIPIIEGNGLTQTAPEYKPTPKLLTLPELGIPSALINKKKKIALEYEPEKPEMDAIPTSPSRKRKSLDNAPVYIPAPTKFCQSSINTNEDGNQANQSDDLDLIDYDEELNEISNIIDNSEEVVNNETQQEQILRIRELKYEDEKKKNNIEIKNTLIDEPKATEEQKSVKISHKQKYKQKDRDKEIEKDKEKNKVEYTKRHFSSSSSTSHKANKKHKHHHKSSSAKLTESRSTKEFKKTNSKSKENSEETRKHSITKDKSSSEKSTPKETLASNSKTNDKEAKDTKENKHSTIKDVNCTNDLDTYPDAKLTRTANLFATSEEEIMKECEMIYDQLEQEFAQQKTEPVNANKERNIVKNCKQGDVDNDKEEAIATHKKRVAHENANQCRKPINAAVMHKPNHCRNAMQAIYNRQNLIRQKQEEEEAQKARAIREAEEKVREANEALRKAQANALTPLIPKSFLTPPINKPARSIAPVANMLALERAKKKIEELKAEKMSMFTVAQTSKGGARIAHKATIKTSTTKEPEKPKPPVLEANSTKISFNIRMQYYEMMVKHCITIYPDVTDAWERAQTEELAVFKKCKTPIIYKSSAMLTINKLRKEAADSGNKPLQGNKIMSHEVVLAGKLANNTSWSVQKKEKSDITTDNEPFDKLSARKAYDMLYELRLTEEQLMSNGFPRPGHKPGIAVMQHIKPMRRPNDTERYCSRCGKIFNLSMYDSLCVDECNYHPKSTGYRRGFADNYHRCCQQPAGTPGCTYGNYHVTDYVDVDNLNGYITTMDKPSHNDGNEYIPTKKDIYALDCEMCYTTEGIELTRVTVVDINARIVYDGLVKPENKIVDYNTTYSGITEQMLSKETRSLRDVQAILMSLFHAKTILIGHSLESDLKALKLIHSVVVDTSVLFPHKMGPPKKRALKTLCIENLKRIIQENDSGHDSAEDAEVCIQLVKFYLRNKIS